jgi:hypothetical protein
MKYKQKGLGVEDEEVHLPAKYQVRGGVNIQPNDDL